jgi:hypothetical protein
MISLILGAFTLGLGIRGFSPGGLPFTKTRNLTGFKAKVIGGGCVALAVVFLLDGVFWAIRMIGSAARVLE